MGSKKVFLGVRTIANLDKRRKSVYYRCINIWLNISENVVSELFVKRYYSINYNKNWTRDNKFLNW